MFSKINIKENSAFLKEKLKKNGLGRLWQHMSAAASAPLWISNLSLQESIKLSSVT